MATINLALPQVTTPAGATGQPLVRHYIPAAVCKDGDFVILNGSGQIAPAASNTATGICGVACHDSRANYAGFTGTGQGDLGAALSGKSQVGSPLVSNQALKTIVAKLNSPMLVEINLSAATGWITGGTNQANIASQVGIGIDASGTYVADPSLSNKVAEVVEKIEGPAFGTAGDTGGRVRIRFNAAAIVN